MCLKKKNLETQPWHHKSKKRATVESNCACESFKWEQIRQPSEHLLRLHFPHALK